MLDYWGLHHNPFGDPHNAEQVFLNKPMKQALAVLKEAAQVQEFAALVGPIGSGKSTIINLLLHQIRDDPKGKAKFEICHLRCIQKERVSGRHILEALIADLPGQERPKQNLEAMTRQVITLVQSVRKNLGRWPVLLVEEAQGLSKDGFRVLKRIREATDDGFRKGLAVILVGQTDSIPDLKTRLEAPDLREVHERCHLVPLVGLDGDVREYINKKLKWGGTRRTTLVDEDAITTLVEHYGGSVTPQSIDHIMTDALIEGFRKGCDCIDGELIQRVL